MVFKRLFPGGRVERKVIGEMREHIQTLHAGCTAFRAALEKGDMNLMLTVADLERDADSIRRGIVSQIYEGAFLPFIRPNLCRFVELVDEAFDLLEDAAFTFEHIQTLRDGEFQEGCLRIAELNIQICEMLLIAFDSLLSTEDLREKSLAIRIYEKKIDETKFDLVRHLMKKEVKTFWEGKALADFVSHLAGVSDAVEDASDYLFTLHAGLR